MRINGELVERRKKARVEDMTKVERRSHSLTQGMGRREGIFFILSRSGVSTYIGVVLGHVFRSLCIYIGRKYV